MPGDVYVLQDARKMRSRLHSDIGRFTARDGEREKENGLWIEEEENDAAQQSLHERDRTGICEGVPIIFRIGDSL